MSLKRFGLLVVFCASSYHASASNIYDKVGRYLEETYAHQVHDFGVKIKYREQGFVSADCEEPYFEVSREISASKKVVGIHCGTTQQFVTATIFGKVEAYVAKRKYARGEVLRSNMFTKKLAPLSSIRSTLPQEMEWGAVQLSKSIPSGGVLTSTDFRAARMFKRGELVKAQFSMGRLLVSGEFKILEDGYPGALVRLLNQDSNEVIYGTVTSKKEIHIQ